MIQPSSGSLLRSARRPAAFLAAAALTLLAAGCFGPPETAPAEDADSPRGGFPQTGSARGAGGVAIAYTVYGEGETVLVLIPGWGGTQALWQSQVDDLAQRFTVLTVDLRGHGASGSSRSGRLADLAKDLEAALEAAGARKAILVGHGLGGLVALEAARARPQAFAGLIGIEAFADRPAGQANELLGRLEADFPGACRSYVRGLFAMTTEEPLVDDTAEIACQIDPALAAELLREQAAFDLGKALAALPPGLPVRSIETLSQPDLPEVLPAETLQRFHADFKTHYIARSGEYPMLEQSAELTRQLAASIEEIGGK